MQFDVPYCRSRRARHAQRRTHLIAHLVLQGADWNGQTIFFRGHLHGV